jgi:hypothetical protein
VSTHSFELEFESASDLYARGDLDAAVVPKFLANGTRTRFGASGPAQLEVRGFVFDGVRVSTFHVNFMFHTARIGVRTALISLFQPSAVFPGWQDAILLRISAGKNLSYQATLKDKTSKH